MRSTRPKVLHAIAGQSLLAHVLDAVNKAGGTKTAVVVGLGADAVAAEAKRVLPDAEIFVQAERRGTAHAVLAAKAAIARAPDDVLVIFGDTPLIRPQTLTRIRGALAEGAALVVLGFRPKDPSGYGRLVLKGGELADLVQAIRVIAGGESLLAPSVTRRLIDTYVSRPRRSATTKHDGLDELTAREREVLGLVAEGLTNAEIAHTLQLSPLTAKTHVSRILMKLGARDRVQLVVIAYQAGLVEP